MTTGAPPALLTGEAPALEYLTVADLTATLFWDYDPTQLDHLPVVVRAQRYVDLWPAIADAFAAGQLDRAGLARMLADVRQAGDAIRYPEPVRRAVIEWLMQRLG